MVVEVGFLMGVIRAGGKGGRIPWPPDPARLFAALVNAWALGGEDPEEEKVLRWLEGTAPPGIAAPDLGPEQAYTAWVPENALREERGKGGKHYSRKRSPKYWVEAPILGKPVVRYFLEPPPADLEKPFRNLLSRVGRLGSSRNPVLASVGTDGEPRWEPAEPRLGDLFLQVWYPGFLEALKARHQMLYLLPQTGVSGVVPAARTWVPLPARTQAYRSRGREAPAPFLELLGVVALRPGLPLHFWPALVERLELPSGLQPLPLAHVGHPHADGRVLGLGLAASRHLEERRLLTGEALARLNGHEEALGSWRIQFHLPDLLPQALASLRPERWQHPARAWVSVTPVAWEGGRDPEEAVARMAREAGLPEPCAFRAGPWPFLRGVPSVRELEPYLPPDLRKASHFYLEFSEPIPGPLRLGKGEALGLGFFFPLKEVP